MRVAAEDSKLIGNSSNLWVNGFYFQCEQCGWFNSSTFLLMLYSINSVFISQKFNSKKFDRKANAIWEIIYKQIFQWVQTCQFRKYLAINILNVLQWGNRSAGTRRNHLRWCWGLEPICCLRSIEWNSSTNYWSSKGIKWSKQFSNGSRKSISYQSIIPTNFI